MLIKIRNLQSSHTADAGSHGDEPHVLPLKVYLGVFAVLLFLTVVTVGVSLLGLPPLAAILVAMAVATVKAVLVAAIFMHLAFEDKFYSFIFVASLFFISLFFGFTLLDLSFRDYINPEQGSEIYRQYENAGDAGGAYKPTDENHAEQSKEEAPPSK